MVVIPERLIVITEFSDYRKLYPFVEMDME
jgi:hypothetical protein